MRAFVTGFRGDWKALKQVMNFSRYADKDKAGLGNCVAVITRSAVSNAISNE